MSFRETGPAPNLTETDRWDGGFSWIAHPEEGMQRASHALAVDGDVWVVDPVDGEGLDDLLADEGNVAGVVILLDRHKRDCAELARRHDVAVHVPGFMDAVTGDLDADTATFSNTLADTGFELVSVVDSALTPVGAWREAALVHPDRGTIVASESLGTTDYFRAPGEHLGVHPMRRLTPPNALTGYDPNRVLVGHGTGVFENAAGAVREAVEHSRSRTPAAYASIFTDLLGG